MATPLILSIETDFAQVTAELNELGELLSLAPDPCRETIDRLLQFSEFFVELFPVRAYDVAAEPAGILLLSAKLTDPAGGLLTALRAGNVDRDVLERAIRHFEASKAATVSATPDESTPDSEAA